MRRYLALIIVALAVSAAAQTSVPGWSVTGGGGGGGSGTVGANSGLANAIAKYSAAAGSTTVGPDSALDDGSTAANTLTYTGTAGINASAGPMVSGATGVQGCIKLFGATSGSSQMCAVGNATEWDATTLATFKLVSPANYGAVSGNTTVSGSTVIMQGTGGSWQISSTGSGNLVAATGKGQHIHTQAANNDLAGVVSGTTTTATVTFTTNYTSTPACVVTPTTAGVTSFIITSQANSGFTVTYAPSGATNFNYVCIGDPN